MTMVPITSLILFGQTPRTGGTGGRFITSDNAGPAFTFDRLQGWEKEIREGLPSDDCIGVRVDVIARHRTGADRKGTEVLIAAGQWVADLRKQNRPQRQRVEELLARRLADFGTLVTSEIQWHRERQRDEMRHPILDKWREEVITAGQPDPVPEPPPRALPSRSTSKREDDDGPEDSPDDSEELLVAGADPEDEDESTQSTASAARLVEVGPHHTVLRAPGPNAPGPSTRPQMPGSSPRRTDSSPPGLLGADSRKAPSVAPKTSLPPEADHQVEGRNRGPLWTLGIVGLVLILGATVAAILLTRAMTEVPQAEFEAAFARTTGVTFADAVERLNEADLVQSTDPGEVREALEKAGAVTRNGSEIDSWRLLSREDQAELEGLGYVPTPAHNDAQAVTSWRGHLRAVIAFMAAPRPGPIDCDTACAQILSSLMAAAIDGEFTVRSGMLNMPFLGPDDVDLALAVDRAWSGLRQAEALIRDAMEVNPSPE